MSNRLLELIGQYGVQCSETKELAPSTELIAEYDKMHSRITALEAEVEAPRKDAERWRILRRETGACRTTAYAYLFNLPRWIGASTNVNLLKGSVAEHLDNAADLARKESGNG